MSRFPNKPDGKEDFVSKIYETSTGVWTADAPAGRSDLDENTIFFIGVNDPRDVTNGIDTPANMIAGDIWLSVSEFV